MDELISSSSRDLPGEDEKYLNNNNNDNLAALKCHDCVEEMAEETTDIPDFDFRVSGDGTYGGACGGTTSLDCRVSDDGTSGGTASIRSEAVDLMEQYFLDAEKAQNSPLTSLHGWNDDPASFIYPRAISSESKISDRIQNIHLKDSPSSPLSSLVAKTSNQVSCEITPAAASASANGIHLTSNKTPAPFASKKGELLTISFSPNSPTSSSSVRSDIAITSGNFSASAQMDAKNPSQRTFREEEGDAGKEMAGNAIMKDGDAVRLDRDAVRVDGDAVRVDVVAIRVDGVATRMDGDVVPANHQVQTHPQPLQQQQQPRLCLSDDNASSPDSCCGDRKFFVCNGDDGDDGDDDGDEDDKDDELDVGDGGGDFIDTDFERRESGRGFVISDYEFFRRSNENLEDCDDVDDEGIQTGCDGALRPARSQFVSIAGGRAIGGGGAAGGGGGASASLDTTVLSGEEERGNETSMCLFDNNSNNSDGVLRRDGGIDRNNVDSASASASATTSEQTVGSGIRHFPLDIDFIDDDSPRSPDMQRHSPMDRRQSPIDRLHSPVGRRHSPDRPVVSLDQSLPQAMGNSRDIQLPRNVHSRPNFSRPNASSPSAHTSTDLVSQDKYEEESGRERRLPWGQDNEDVDVEFGETDLVGAMNLNVRLKPERVSRLNGNHLTSTNDGRGVTPGVRERNYNPDSNLERNSNLDRAHGPNSYPDPTDDLGFIEELPNGFAGSLPPSRSFDPSKIMEEIEDEDFFMLPPTSTSLSSTTRPSGLFDASIHARSFPHQNIENSRTNGNVVSWANGDVNSRIDRGVNIWINGGVNNQTNGGVDSRVDWVVDSRTNKDGSRTNGDVNIQINYPIDFPENDSTRVFDAAFQDQSFQSNGDLTSEGAALSVRPQAASRRQQRHLDGRNTRSNDLNAVPITSSASYSALEHSSESKLADRQDVLRPPGGGRPLPSSRVRFNDGLHLQMNVVDVEPVVGSDGNIQVNGHWDGYDGRRMDDGQLVSHNGNYDDNLAENRLSPCSELPDFDGFKLDNGRKNRSDSFLPLKRRSYSDEHIYEDIDPLPPPPSQAKDNLNFPSSTFDKGRASKGKLQKALLNLAANRRPSADRVMLWSEEEAALFQVKQLGASACGPTAVLTILRFFHVTASTMDIHRAIKANLRQETAPVPQYLFSRSVAGTCAEDLISGVSSLSGGEVVGRFFSFFPARDVNLKVWLASWIEKGAVPVMTLNLQRGVPYGHPLPDAWHHQMVYGVDAEAVYLTNPLERVPNSTIEAQLTSESVLLVRSGDVLKRWAAGTDLTPLLSGPPKANAEESGKWRTMNVLGQVVNVVREHFHSRKFCNRGSSSCSPSSPFGPAHALSSSSSSSAITTHVRIPAMYTSGVTVFVRAGSQAHRSLNQRPELTLKADDDARPNGMLLVKS